MPHLPSEILHLIISYLTKNEIPSLLKFRTICKSWKEASEHSLVWLKAPLTITVPPKFAKAFGIYDCSEANAAIGLHAEIQSIDRKLFRIHLNDETEQSPLTLTVELTHNEDQTITVPRVVIDRFERAHDTSINFLSKYRIYHEAWDNFLVFYKSLSFFHNISSQWIGSDYFVLCFIFTTAALVASAYLLSTIPNHPTSLSTTEVVGFACIYWNGGFFLFNVILRMLGMISQAACYDNYVDIKRSYSLFLKGKVLLCYHIPISLLVAFISSIALLQAKFSNVDSTIKYSYIMLPFWFNTAFVLVLIALSDLEDKLKGVCFWLVLCLIYATCTMIGVYADSSSHGGLSSLGYAFLPMLPFEVGMLGGSLYRLWSTAMLWFQFLTGTEIAYSTSGGKLRLYRRVFYRLLMNAFATSSVVMMFLLLVNLNYEGFEDRLDLSTGLVSLVLMLVLTQVAIFGLKGDNPYLH